MGPIVIKLGSSIVADDAGQPRAEVLQHVCEQAAALHRAGRDVAIVTSGAIARGMGVMRFAERPRAIDELQAASAVGQGKLYAFYDELLRGHGIASAQVLLTFHDISGERAHYLNARQTLRKLLEWRVVPVVNENDTTATDEITFGDNDFLAAQVAILLGAELLILLTSTDGLYTADPRLDPSAQLVSHVDDFAALDALDIRQTTTTLGSGGMRSKVVAAEMATAAGIPAIVANGTSEGVIGAAVAGEPVGTRFAPQEGRYSSFKLWLKYAKPPHGPIRSTRAPRARCARAARACCRSGSSASRASSTPATRSRSCTTARRSGRGSRAARPRTCGA